MEIILIFELLNISDTPPLRLEMSFQPTELFIEALRKLLAKYAPHISLDQVAAVTKLEGILTPEQAHRRLSELVGEVGNYFKITLRSLVNGPNLLDYAPTEEELQEVPKKSLRGGLPEKLIAELKSKMSPKEEDSFTQPENEVEERREQAPPPPPGGTPPKAEQPQRYSAPPSPKPAPPDQPAPSGTPSGPPSEPPSVSAPPPEPSPPPAPVLTPESSEQKEAWDNGPQESTPSLEKQKAPAASKAKKKKAVSEKLRQRAMEKKAEIADLLSEDAVDDEAFAAYEELEEEAPEVVGGRKPRTYNKSCAVDYFDVMNPEKYYPLTLTISDIKQAARAKTENIITGERLTRKVEEMEVELEDSFVKVKPVFPGCAVTPGELWTDLKSPEDQLTFYVTPLVNSEITESRVEVLDAYDNVIYAIDCPCEVKDPRYSRVVALYGILASSLPKILTLFGVDAVNEVDISQIIPSVLDFLGNVSLGNFIGIAGIIVSLIVSLIIYLRRGDKSTQRSFKLSDIRKPSGIGRMRIRSALSQD